MYYVSIGLGIRSATGVFGGIVSLLLISKRLTLMVGLLIPAMVFIGTIYGRYELNTYFVFCLNIF